MRLRNRLLIQTFFIFCSLAAAISFAEVVVPPMPDRYVIDLAGIVDDAAEAKLNAYLQELEQKTTAQVIVLTIQSLEGRAIEDFSLKTAEKWRLGQKGKDNGVLFLVSLQDREYRFEIGYGIEGILPDSLAGSIGREYLVPNFKKGDYSNGIFLATLFIANKIASQSGVEITGMPELNDYSHKTKSTKPTLFNTIFTVLFFIGMIYLFIRHPRLLLFLFMMNMMGGGRRSSWSGGGFGGFGGGGGGGFGGGGASGSW